MTNLRLSALDIRKHDIDQRAKLLGEKLNYEIRKAKKLLALLVIALPTLASAEPYDIKGMDAFCEHQEVLTIKQHAINADGSYKYSHRSKVRFIDGSQPAIEIAGRDNGYVVIPQKAQGVYHGR